MNKYIEKRLKIEKGQHKRALTKDIPQKTVICNSMKDIMSAKQLGKTYGDITVLKGIDLNIKKGEIVAITGPSGAGKTTLLQILGTLTSPDSTAVTSLIIEQTKVLDLNDKALARFHNESLGFIFQFHELLDEFSALENVMIPA